MIQLMPIVKLEDESIINAVTRPNAQVDREEERLKEYEEDATPDLEDIRCAHSEPGLSEGVV